MKNKELKEQIVGVLQDHDRLSPQEIAYKVDGDPAMIQVHGVLGRMKSSGEVVEDVTDEKKYYSLNKPDHRTDNKRRSLTKYTFNGCEGLSKGRLVHAIIKKYIETVNPSLKELKTRFPDSIAKPYGVIQSKVTAFDLSPDPKRKRYFLNDDDILHLSKGKVKQIVVTNQWTPDRITKLLAVAEGELGYKVSVE